MKHLLHSIAILITMCLMQTANAATVSGTIYTTGGIYGNPAVPAAGATVLISPGLNWTLVVVATTNSSGYYSATIPSGWSFPYPLLDVRDSASGGCYNTKQVSYTGSSVVV